MDYQTLRQKAIRYSNKTNLQNLAEWFLNYGGQYWNGEYYDADDYKLYPIYKETEPDNFEIIGWKLI